MVREREGFRNTNGSGDEAIRPSFLSGLSYGHRLRQAQITVDLYTKRRFREVMFFPGRRFGSLRGGKALTGSQA